MDELLIELVRARKAIWDASDKRHANRDYVKKMWTEISEELSQPCKCLYFIDKNYFFFLANLPSATQITLNC